jgi:hypothetical protein
MEAMALTLDFGISKANLQAAADRRRGILQAALGRAVPLVKGLLASRQIQVSGISYEDSHTGPSIRVEGRSGTYPFSFGFQASLKNNEFLFSREAFLKDLDACIQAAAQRQLSPDPERLLAVDLSKVTARVAGKTTLYASADLPIWSFHVEASEISSMEGRRAVGARLLASLRETVQRNYNAKAVFATEQFRLPEPPALAPVKASLQASADIEASVKAQVTFQTLVQRGIIRDEATIQAKAQDGPEAKIRAEVRSLCQIPVRQALGSGLLARGSQVSVTAVDASDVRYSRGRLEGTATIRARYQGPKGFEIAEIKVPVVAGKIVAKDLTFTEAHVKAAAAKLEALKLWSAEEEAKYLKDLEAKVGASSIKAWTNDSFSNHAPHPRIPILQGLLPSSVKAGDEVAYSGYVYKVYPTNYQSVSADRSAWWMLGIVADKMPESKHLDVTGLG